VPKVYLHWLSQSHTSSVRAVGFDWETQVWGKSSEELDEFQVEVQAGDQDKMEEEFGMFYFR
jgi:XTP/dITP diphosphohydrolase